MKLVIEIDGKNHERKDQIDYDAKRTNILKEFGIRVMRFRNDQIENNVRMVVETIKEKCELFIHQITPLKNEICRKCLESILYPSPKARLAAKELAPLRRKGTSQNRS